MMKHALWLVACVTALTFATAAEAATYTVTLKNGTSFETRYEPVTAEWDAGVRMILTDRGNWIALEAAEIADVSSAIELSGFGYQLDATTIVIGRSPNDLPDEEGAEGGASAAAEPPPPPDFTIEQFVNTPTVGSPSGGIPATYIR